jgi:hypothetical protein
MNQAIQAYNETQAESDKEICHLLATTIDAVLKEAENKIWHAHPVWFIDGNPIVKNLKMLLSFLPALKKSTQKK